MIRELDLLEFNELENSFQRTCASSSNTCDIIEASSIQRERIKWKRKTPKKGKELKSISSLKSEQLSESTLRPTSSLKPMLKASTTPIFSCFETLSAPELTQKKPATSTQQVNEMPQEKCSKSMFSSESSFEKLETPIFNRTRDLGSSASVVTLNDKFMSECEERLHKSPIISQLDQEWEDLSQEITKTRNSSKPTQLQKNISSTEHPSQSEVSLNRTIESPAHENSYDLQQSDDYSESDKRSGMNEFMDSVNERLITQNLNQSLLNEQNHQISTQLQNFECFVREKMNAAEDYIKEKMTQIEASNLAIVDALNDIKRVKQDASIRMNEMESKRTPGFVMPKIPVSKDFSLVILNSALKNKQYMEQFVSEVSHLVTLNAYNPKKSVKLIMIKLFTLNLLIKYNWSGKAYSQKPTFSTLNNVLKAIFRLLTDYMSERDTRREIKEFFKEIPQIYKKQKKRHF